MGAVHALCTFMTCRPEGRRSRARRKAGSAARSVARSLRAPRLRACATSVQGTGSRRSNDRRARGEHRTGDPSTPCTWCPLWWWWWWCDSPPPAPHSIREFPTGGNAQRHPWPWPPRWRSQRRAPRRDTSAVLLRAPPVGHRGPEPECSAARPAPLRCAHAGRPARTPTRAAQWPPQHRRGNAPRRAHVRRGASLCACGDESSDVHALMPPEAAQRAVRSPCAWCHGLALWRQRRG